MPLNEKACYFSKLGKNSWNKDGALAGIFVAGMQQTDR
jgi:hypothetical protein